MAGRIFRTFNLSAHPVRTTRTPHCEGRYTAPLQDVLCPVHSPLLWASIFLSSPAGINMLKFPAWY